MSVLSELKPKDSYPKSYIRELKLLEVDKQTDDAKFIGSSSYRKSLYASDLDIYEGIVKTATEPEVVNFFKRGIQRVVSDVIHKPYHYVLEVKCGLDHRYDIDIGKCVNGVYSPPRDLLKKFQIMHDMGLFNDEEFNMIHGILNNIHPSQIEYETLMKIVRGHNIIRWTANEVLQGKKILIGGVLKTLEDAIDDKSPINIETIALVNGKYSDVSNFYEIACVDPRDGKMKGVNVIDENINNVNHMVSTLKKSIEQMMYSKLDKNYMKACKRMFSLARRTVNNELMKRSSEIVNSELGYLYQIKAEIALLIKVFEKIEKPDMNVLNRQIQNIKYKLSNVMQIPREFLMVLNDRIDNLENSGYDRAEYIKVFDEIKEVLMEIVNEGTKVLMQKQGLYPVPNFVLPDRRVF